MSEAAKNNRGLIKFSSNQKVMTKISLGFGSVVVIFLIVIALSFWNFVRIGHEVHEMEEAALELELAAKVELQYLKMIRAVREFVQKGDDASEAQTQMFAAETRKAIANAQAGIKIESHLALVAEISEHFEKYMTSFEKVAKLKHHHDDYISDVLDPTADKMIIDLDGIVKDAREENNDALANKTFEAREHVFLIQVYIGRLLLEQKEEYGEKIAYEFAVFEKT